MNAFDEKKRFSTLSIALLISVGLHMAFLVTRFAISHAPAPQIRSDEPIEIAEVPKEYLQPQPTVPQPKSKEQVIAESEKADNEELDPNAKFLGERNQKAQKQMKADQVDDFRNKQGTGGKTKSADKMAFIPPSGETKGEAEKVDDDGILPAPTKGGVKRNWKTLSMKDLSVGGDGGARASTDDNLDGVETGDRTILSTREFKFYSYYHRIKELLRQHWKPNIEQQLVRMWGKGKAINSDEFITRVLVTLDNHGQLQRVSRLGSSGSEEIDEAAVVAFHKAAPFPNPPHGMIDEDGFVRIRWDFILKAETGPAIQFRTAGGGSANRY